MFISFEGIDFCGKSTQVKLLSDYLLNERGFKIQNIREPGGTQISEKIRTILLDRKIFDMTIQAEILLFSASRSQLVQQVIKPSLNEGTVVISDRFHDSTTAYQGFGRGISIEYIETINRFAIDGTLPDVTFILDIDVETAEKRRVQKNTVPDRMESAGKEFFTRVRDGYLTMARSDKRFVVIDGKMDVMNIHKEIINEVENRFKL